MIWKVTSTDGKRWVSWDGVGGYTADPVTDGTLAAIGGQPVETATNAELYIPRENPDQLGVYLWARKLLGADATVSGTPPIVPESADGDPFDDTVY